jgi:hypothetical protein
MIDVFLKVHQFELLNANKISVDVEVIVIEGNQTLANQPVEFIMNEKSHRLVTMTDGRLRAELVFPFVAEEVQQLRAVTGSSGEVSCQVDLVPPGMSHTEPEQQLTLDDVFNNRRAIGRGEVFTIEKGFYDVPGDITIQRGGTLIIQPGTTLEFGEKAGIVCEGMLHAIGTEKENITFTAWRSHWRNILFYGRHTARTRMEHCLIEHGAGRALQKDKERDIYLPQTIEGQELERFGGGLQFLYTRKAEIGLNYLFIRENSVKKGRGGGIYMFDSAPVMAKSRLYQNEGLHGGGLYIGGESAVHARFNSIEIEDNKAIEDGGGIFLDTFSPLFSDTEIFANEARFGAGLYHHGLAPEDIHLADCRLEDNISHSMPGDTEGFAGS